MNDSKIYDLFFVFCFIKEQLCEAYFAISTTINSATKVGDNNRAVVSVAAGGMQFSDSRTRGPDHKRPHRFE